MHPLTVFFLLYALLELWLLILAGGAIGAGPVVLWVIASAVLGLVLLQRQGLSTLQRGRERLQLGELPGRELLEGGLLAMGAALLLAPGLLGDTLGLACLVPPLRHRLVSRLVGRPLPGGFGRMRQSRTSDESKGPVIIEGDYVRHEADDSGHPAAPGDTRDSHVQRKDLPPAP